MTSPLMVQYRTRKNTFRMHPSIGSAQALMRSGQLCWEAGFIGEATFVREVLEPVRDHLLAGNQPEDLARKAVSKAKALHDQAWALANGEPMTGREVSNALSSAATLLEQLAGERTTVKMPPPAKNPLDTL